MSLQSLQIGTRALFSPFFSGLVSLCRAYVGLPNLGIEELPELFGEGKKFEVTPDPDSDHPHGHGWSAYNTILGVEIYYSSCSIDGRLVETVNIIHEGKVGMRFVLVDEWMMEFERPGIRPYARTLLWHETKAVGEFMESLRAMLELPQPFD